MGKSNKRKIVRTPGGKLVFQYLKKRPSVPKCPMTGLKLKGVKPATNQEKSKFEFMYLRIYIFLHGCNIFNRFIIIKLLMFNWKRSRFNVVNSAGMCADSCFSSQISVFLH